MIVIINLSLTYLYFGSPYLLEGASQGSYPEPALKAYIIFFFVTCDMFDLMIMYSAAVLDAQTQNGDEPVGEYSFSGQSCLSSANSC